MATDPRLQDVQLLAVAAYRVHQRREAARKQPPDWRFSVGISTLLEAARALPRRDPWTMPTVEDGGGLARLLQEARQWQEERDHGA